MLLERLINMSKYVVTSSLSSQEWQVKNETSKYDFTADAADKTGGPDPVEYIAGAINSCISISAGMVARAHRLDIRDFKLKTVASTRKLPHGMSDIAQLEITASFTAGEMSTAEKHSFLEHALHVSTVYQTLIKAIDIKVTLL